MNRYLRQIVNRYRTDASCIGTSSWYGFNDGMEMSIFRNDFISNHIVPFASFFSRELSNSEVSEISGLLMKAYNI